MDPLPTMFVLHAILLTMLKTTEVSPCAIPSLDRYVYNVTYNGRQALISCAPGYFIAGREIIDCVLGGWMYDFPTCEKIKLACSSVGPIRYGGVEQDGYEAKFYCQQNYTLIGNHTLFCVDGRWDKPKPSCRKDATTTTDGTTTPQPIYPPTIKQSVPQTIVSGNSSNGTVIAVVVVVAAVLIVVVITTVIVWKRRRPVRPGEPRADAEKDSSYLHPIPVDPTSHPLVDQDGYLRPARTRNNEESITMQGTQCETADVYHHYESIPMYYEELRTRQSDSDTNVYTDLQH